MTNRMFSVICCVGGLSCLIAGLEKTGYAVNCTEVEHGSKVCIHPQVGAPTENASGGYCELDSGGSCIPSTSGNTCADRYGVIQPARCFPHLVGSAEIYTCYADSVQTVLNLPLYTGECITEGSNCTCKWTKTAMTQPATVCDCYDVKQ